MHDLNRQALRPATEHPLYALQGLAFRYPDGTEALRGIELQIAPGDRIALVGQNGSGKTTLVHHLAGLLRGSDGELRYRGVPLDGDRLAAARFEIGLLFQDPDDQLFCNTVLEDVAFGPRNRGLDPEPALEVARQSLETVGLLHLAYKPPHQLSPGQRKRAALAGLLALDPEVLILDEPTANLDPRQEQVFLDLLTDYPGTLVCISHDLLFLYEFCDRAVVLDRGRVHHDYAMRELVSQRSALREHGLDFTFRFARSPKAAACGSPPAASPPSSPERPPGQAPAVADPLIRLRDYRFSYPDGTRALQGIDLDLEAGERLAVVGENGAGKSTLLACLLGLHQGRGEYLFGGRPVTRRSRRDLWRRVGMVFQDCGDQLFCPSCAEEVAFGPRQHGLPESEVARRVASALARVRLEGYEERVPIHLSGGERKRLAIAAVLSLEPEVLILDEPSAGLDPQGEELLLEILRGLKCTLILVSHDLFFVGELTRRTLVMHQGRLLRDYPTASFLEDPELAALNRDDYAERHRRALEILELQHRHEHTHSHRHLHDHPHRHGDLVHSHPHEHEHEHAHAYEHAHPLPGAIETGHRHPTDRREAFHRHEHPGHEEMPHHHDHRAEETGSADESTGDQGTQEADQQK